MSDFADQLRSADLRVTRPPSEEELRLLRERLEDRATFQQAAAEVQGWKPRAEAPPQGG